MILDDAARARVLIFGTGIIGGSVADFLSRMERPYDILVASRDEQRTRERANLTAAVAISLGYTPYISTSYADVRCLESTSELIARYGPDVIVNATSRQTFWKISTLPDEQYRLLRPSGLGPWLPQHLSTATALMRAVADSGTYAKVVNAAFPDAVNPVLSRVGIGPLTGAGNIGNAIPTLRRAAAKILQCSLDQVAVQMAAHHAVTNAIATDGDPGQAPFLLKIIYEGVDVTDHVPVAELFGLFVRDFRRTRGVAGQVMAASGVAAVVRALLSDIPTIHHVPGPLGLPGGYPARIGNGTLEIQPPLGTKLVEAIEVNEAGQVYEGIQSIAPDGTVEFAPAQMSILTRAFGYECSKMRPCDVDDWADELDARYANYAANIRGNECQVL